MSNEISMEIKFSNIYDVVEILKNFKKSGWSICDCKGKVSYLPIGDNDDYNWQDSYLSDADFYNIVRIKQQNEEVIGIILFWKDSDTGITVLFLNNNSIIVSFSINRRKIDMNDSRSMTDVNWYIDHIVNQVDGISYYKIESFI